MNVCVVEQTCGLGDILMSIKIGCHFSAHGYKVVWPVEPIYRNLQNNIYVEGDIEFPCVEDEFELKEIYQKLKQTPVSDIVMFDNGVIYAPLRRAWHSQPVIEMKQKYGSDECNMLGKFVMCGLTHHDWQDYFSINRNRQKENELIDVLGIQDTDQIHLVNKEFGTPPYWSEVLEKEIVTPKHLKRVEMRVVDGYDLFDWIGIFEKASQIDTVTTSNFYIFEKIDLQCIPTIYSKNNASRSYEDNWGWMEKLAKKEYKFVT
jgi:hypothetical protein